MADLTLNISTKLVHYAKQIKLKPLSTWVYYNLATTSINQLQTIFPTNSGYCWNSLIENAFTTADLIIANISELNAALAHDLLLQMDNALTSQGLILFATFAHESVPNRDLIHEEDVVKIAQTIRLWHLTNFHEYLTTVNSQVINCQILLASKSQLDPYIKAILKIDHS